MKFNDIKTGEIFNLGNTPSYPKLKTDKGYVDMRDEIVNNDPNGAVLSAEITIMSNKDLEKKFTTSPEEIEEWLAELMERYT